MKSPKEILEKGEVSQKLGLLRCEDGKDHELPQDFADMLGWKELAAKIDTIYNKLPKDTQTIFFC